MLNFYRWLFTTIFNYYSQDKSLNTLTSVKFNPGRPAKSPHASSVFHWLIHVSMKVIRSFAYYLWMIFESPPQRSQILGQVLRNEISAAHLADCNTPTMAWAMDMRLTVPVQWHCTWLLYTLHLYNGENEPCGESGFEESASNQYSKKLQNYIISVINNNNVRCRTWIVTCPFTQTFSLLVETSQLMSFARVHSIKLTCIQTSSIVCHHLPHSVLHVITPLLSSKSDMLTKTFQLFWRKRQDS